MLPAAAKQELIALLGPRGYLDRPEDLADELEVIAVSPYLSDDPHDRGLRAVARRAGLSSSPGG